MHGIVLHMYHLQHSWLSMALCPLFFVESQKNGGNALCKGIQRKVTPRVAIAAFGTDHVYCTKSCTHMRNHLEHVWLSMALFPFFFVKIINMLENSVAKGFSVKCPDCASCDAFSRYFGHIGQHTALKDTLCRVSKVILEHNYEHHEHHECYASAVRPLVCHWTLRLDLSGV